MNKQNSKIDGRAKRVKNEQSFLKFQTKIQSDFLKIYQQLNKRLFDNSLPLCQIAFYPIIDSYGEVYVDGVSYNNANYPFLILNIQYFKYGVDFIIGILIHEMVHIYCFENNIEDINYKTGYHNTKFKLACEKFNLKCEKGDYGYNNVVITPFVKNITDDILKKIELTDTLSKYKNNI